MTELSLALAGLINLIVAILPWILAIVGVIFLIWLTFFLVGLALVAKGMDQRPRLRRGIVGGR